MIYNEDFVWVHFPKIAGTKIEEIFSNFFYQDKSIIQDEVGVFRSDGSMPWHDSINDRINYDPSFFVGNKKIIVCVRRLPGWLCSRYNFEIDRNPQLDHNLNDLIEGRFLESNGYLNNADYYMKKYLPEDILERENVVFIRMENFENDFKRAFSEFVDLNTIPDEIFMKRSNSSTSHIPYNWLDDKIKEKMYQSCPRWARFENIAYEESAES